MSESREVLKKVFNNFDSNQNGYIDLSELENLIQTAGYKITKKEAQDLVKEFDKDLNDKLDVDEFVNMMDSFLSRGGQKPESDQEKIFQLFDQNKDGYISRTELEVILNKILKVNFTPEALNEFFLKADTDKDDKINLEEFKAVADELKIFKAA